MSRINISIDELASTVMPLLGRTPDDPELRKFLESVGSWPVPPFGPEDFVYNFEDKEHGFALMFQDAATLPEDLVQGIPARSPVLWNVMLFPEGKDGYTQFRGAMPAGVIWSDTPTSLEAKLGTPKDVIKNRKTGGLMGYNWEMDGHVFGIAFKKNGSLDTVSLSLV